MDNISKHITYNEAIASATAKKKGIENKPSDSELSSMKLVALNVFEPVREHFNTPIYISSFYRYSALNSSVSGASSSSQHSKGEAIDVDADIYGGITNVQIFNYVKDNLKFDQLIAEDLKSDGSIGWVHFSYKKGALRNKITVMVKVNGESKYFPYDPSKGLDKSKYTS